MEIKDMYYRACEILSKESIEGSGKTKEMADNVFAISSFVKEITNTLSDKLPASNFIAFQKDTNATMREIILMMAFLCLVANDPKNAQTSIQAVTNMHKERENEKNN